MVLYTQRFLLLCSALLCLYSTLYAPQGTTNSITIIRSRSREIMTELANNQVSPLNAKNWEVTRTHSLNFNRTIAREEAPRRTELFVRTQSITRNSPPIYQAVAVRTQQKWYLEFPASPCLCHPKNLRILVPESVARILASVRCFCCVKHNTTP